MSTPYDRAKPPHPTIPEIYGCRVCGADPTHFAPGVEPLFPLCNGCDAVGLPTASAFGAAVFSAIPVPSTILILVAMMVGLVCICGWLSR